MADGQLGAFLSRVADRYQEPFHLERDPLSAVVRYPRDADREIVGFLAAGLSFGNVTSILRGIDQALAPLGDHPATTLGRLSREEALRLTMGFRYRWIGDRDLANVYSMLGEAIRRHGGLEPVFASGMRDGAVDVLKGAAALVAGLGSLLPDGEVERRGTRYFLPDVAGQGASKRLHMYLRWMVRTTWPDLGIWTSAEPSQLLLPLDTHVARIGRYLGLTSRKSNGAATVQEMTRNLRTFAPEDPIQFDFALSRLGILGHCPRKRDRDRCATCDLVSVCQL